MSENIKEIINDLQRVADRKCYPEDILCGSIAQEWTDYITDLYEENERLNNIIKEVINYIEDRFFINEETGEYCLTHTFDDGNLYELMKILKENK